jgi:FKBP-type peptidyl-prolyl cis-trans isomerase SlyD
MSDEPESEPETEPADVSADDGADEEHQPEPDEEEAGDDGDLEAIQEGDFVRLEYVVRTVEDGTVIDTTREDVAEEAGIDQEGHEFEPRVIVVGAGHLFQAVDEDLVGKAAGDEGTVTIPGEEAFGEFDPDDVRTVSAEKIDEDDRYPGAQVSVDGQQGRVETIIGGRARVDFNHPLAGQDLEYDYEVLEVVEDRIERARGLLGMYLQQVPEMHIQTDEVDEERTIEVDPDEAEDDDEDADPEFETVTETVEKESLYIEATPQMSMNQQWLFSKQQIAQDLMDRLDLDRVVVQEIIDGAGGMGMGMGGMMGGMGGGMPTGEGDVEEALEDVDVDADELVEELETDE